MHKGLLSLWSSIFKEKCWDNFYILITEKDLIKIVLDIKIAWGWGRGDDSVKQEGSQRKCVNLAGIWSCFYKVQYAFPWSHSWTEATFTGLWTHQGTEKRYREEARCVQPRSPVFPPPPPTTSPHPSIPSQVPRTNPELRLGLCSRLIPTQYACLMAKWLPCPKPQLSAFLLTLFTHWVSQFLHSRIPQSFSLHLQVPGLRTHLPPGSLPGWSSAWPLHLENPAHRMGPVAHWGQLLPPTAPPRVIFPDMSPTLSRHPVNFSQTSCRSTFLQDVPRRVDTLRQHSWACSQHLFTPRGRTNSLQTLGFLPVGSSETLRYGITPTLLGPPHKLFVEEVFSLSKPQMFLICCYWLDT